MKYGFVLNCRQKEKFVAKAVTSALAQTVPCEIVISDQFSTDGTLAEIHRAVKEFGPTHHKVGIFRCPIKGAYGMRSCNSHFRWAWQQLSPEVETIFQLSADDFSLPDRVKACMEAVDGKPYSAVACTMYFADPGDVHLNQVSGYPTETGYVDAADGLMKLAYGSVITAYRRDFLERTGDGGPNTLDVYLGFLAALNQGFYVVTNPKHVHVRHASLDNMGFGGKMLAAQGEESLRLAELNHFQLAQLYQDTLEAAHAMHPEGIDQRANNAALSMILGQTKGWLEARKKLHIENVTPGVLLP